MKKLSLVNAAALLALLMLSCVTAATAEPVADPQTQFEAGNGYLEKGDLDSALQAYQMVIRQGYQGAALAYNVGNVYFRKGERGNAILWYERARRLAPRDSDVDFNLSLARSHLKDEQENVFLRPLTYFTTGELGWATTALVWIFFVALGCALVGWLPMESWTRVTLWLSGTLLVITAAWFAGQAAWSARPEAIVISPPGEVRNGPGPDYAVGFTVPEGSKVSILSQRPDWTQVGVPQQGLKGWMPSAEVEAINQGLGVRAG